MQLFFGVIQSILFSRLGGNNKNSGIEDLSLLLFALRPSTSILGWPSET
jgi:hypothetical protein